MSATTETPVRGAGVRVPRPRTVLLAALVVALASLAAAWLGIGWWASPVLVLAAVAVTVFATASAVRRDSVFVAPIAIALVAVLNPLVLGGLGTHVRETAGMVTFDAGRGLVLWKNYPGIGGWELPDEVQPINVVAFGDHVQRSVRSVVDATSGSFGWTWEVREGRVGLGRIANGYGGAAEFYRVDSTPWRSTSFDGSAEQRAVLVAAAQAAADELALTTVADEAGDVTAGDGGRTWSDATGTLTLRVEGSAVEISYVGGPVLGGTQAEFDLRLGPYRGLTPPEPFTSPDLP